MPFSNFFNLAISLLCWALWGSSHSCSVLHLNFVYFLKSTWCHICSAYWAYTLKSAVPVSVVFYSSLVIISARKFDFFGAFSTWDGHLAPHGLSHSSVTVYSNTFWLAALMPSLQIIPSSSKTTMGLVKPLLLASLTALMCSTTMLFTHHDSCEMCTLLVNLGVIWTSYCQVKYMCIGKPLTLQYYSNMWATFVFHF